MATPRIRKKPPRKDAGKNTEWCLIKENEKAIVGFLIANRKASTIKIRLISIRKIIVCPQAGGENDDDDSGTDS